MNILSKITNKCSTKVKTQAISLQRRNAVKLVRVVDSIYEYNIVSKNACRNMCINVDYDVLSLADCTDNVKVLNCKVVDENENEVVDITDDLNKFDQYFDTDMSFSVFCNYIFHVYSRQLSEHNIKNLYMWLWIGDDVQKEKLENAMTYNFTQVMQCPQSNIIDLYDDTSFRTMFTECFSDCDTETDNETKPEHESNMETVDELTNENYFL